jgi:hypothetical protein
MLRRSQLFGTVSVVALVVAVALVGFHGARPGTAVELSEDGEWYYGSFMPQLDYSPQRRAALAQRKQEQTAEAAQVAAIQLMQAAAAARKAIAAPVPKLSMKARIDANLNNLKQEANALGVDANGKK